jgi:type II secretory ATPase GspE/PulE/Tfp pilus assembly ATPase PilB-like protein
MANLDIAERRLPQDGRIELTVGEPVDLRVAVLPTMFGESVVMRVLDRSNVSSSSIASACARTTWRWSASDQQAQRDRDRHRPDRLGQDDDALRRR